MKKTTELPHAPMPPRPEMRDLPEAPRMVMEVSRLLRYRVRRDEAAGGVMAQQAARALMAHLAVCGESNQLALAERTRFSTPTVSILLRKMEAEGYVCRRPAPEDRRVMLVSLTKKGIEFDREHLNRVFAAERCALAGFTAEEEQQLMALLSRMRKNLREE